MSGQEITASVALENLLRDIEESARLGWPVLLRKENIANGWAAIGTDELGQAARDVYSIVPFDSDAVVTALRSHAELVKALEDLDAVLDFSDENLEPVWTFEDLTAVRAAFKQATAALATLTARKVG